MKRKIILILFIFASLISNGQIISDNGINYNKKAIFIHHSTGGRLIADNWGNLGKAMNDSGYFLSDAGYDWDATLNEAIGDKTDIGHWWTWFMDQTVQSNDTARRDNIMGSVYTEYLQDASSMASYGTYTRNVSDPGGENEIIIFKSCYPNSDIIADNTSTPAQMFGTAEWTRYTESNVRALYDTILVYLKANPEKMFIAFTAPPNRTTENGARARAFNNWLVNDWLQDANWVNKNVYVYDYYNVLTDENNHHWVVNGEIVHYTDPESSNNADVYADGPTTSRPSPAGQQKVTGEFMPVLDIWYNTWRGGGVDEIPPSVPTGLQVTSESINSVSLLWDPSTDNVAVSGYRVYRSGTLLGTSTGLNYMDNTVTACTDYTYTVTAFDEAGNESAQSVGLVANTNIQSPEAILTQPSCLNTTGTIEVTFPTGSGIEYSIDSQASWVTGSIFAGLASSTSYTIHVRNTITDPTCISSSVFIIDALPPAPVAPTVSTTAPVNECPSTTIDLTQLLTSSTPTGGSVFFKILNTPVGADVPDPTAVGTGSYYIFYQNQEGCFSTGTEVMVNITACPPDLAPTLLVNPNINHGATTFNLIVKVAELNKVNTSGTITVHIPRDPRWYLTDGFVTSLTTLGTASLNNSNWSYSSDTENHIFTSIASIPEGGSSTFGFRITFTPDSNRGEYTITTRVVAGGGEVRVDNNEDSERIDFFE